MISPLEMSGPGEESLTETLTLSGWLTATHCRAEVVKNCESKTQPKSNNGNIGVPLIARSRLSSKLKEISIDFAPFRLRYEKVRIHKLLKFDFGTSILFQKVSYNFAIHIFVVKQELEGIITNGFQIKSRAL